MDEASLTRQTSSCAKIYSSEVEGTLAMTCHVLSSLIQVVIVSTQASRPISSRPCHANPAQNSICRKLDSTQGLHTLLDALEKIKGDWELIIVGNTDVDRRYTESFNADLHHA